MLICIVVLLSFIAAGVGYIVYVVHKMSHVTHKMAARFHAPFDKKPQLVPNSQYWQQDPNHCVCPGCNSVVARYDERGVCANCISEGK